MPLDRKAWLTATGGALIVVLGVVGFQLVQGGDNAATAVATSSPTPSEPTTPPSGWNMHDGGLLSDSQVSSPEAEPDGGSVAGQGQSARVAGPGDYVGFTPASLTLPSGKVSPISPAGVRTDGTLAVPDDPAKVGWWTGGALSGERYGGVVLAGHVDSRQYGLGVLAEMLRIKPGAVLTVTGGQSGQRQQYRVTQVQQVPKARLAADTDVFDQNVSQRLVLITCGGAFDRKAHHYQDNIVVIAVPIT